MNNKIRSISGLFLLLVLMLCACGKEYLLLEPVGDSATLTEEAVTEDIAGTAENAGESLYVYICGAVSAPGVYELTSGSRIYDALNMAGGFDEEADRDAVNLAEVLADGQQVRIPYIGEGAEQTGSGLIDINRADISLLCEIPGIGESRAQAIVDYREEQGGFDSIEELMKVPGIKEGLFARISPYVECGN